MQTKFILPCLLSTLFFLNSLSSSAQNRKTIETTTDILMFITPVAGFAGSLAIGDYQGTKQIIFSGATNLAMTAYVGWGRTYAKKHDWWDVIGGAAIGTASSYIFTRPFARKHHFTFSPAILDGQHPGFYISIQL